MTQYSGPGSQEIANRYTTDWEETLARNGYIIACCDARGTGYRGEAYKKVTYANLGHCEVEDQISFARHLASQEFIDASRNVEALSKRFFSADEHSRLLVSENTLEDFFALWVKKEALAKLSGEGLAYICRGQNLNESAYSFKEHSLSVDGGVARLALCFEGAAPNIVINDTYQEIKIYEIQN
jgi:hypothetical protein